MESSNEYLRFRWLIEGRLAGGPHPDLSEGLVSVADFLHAEGVGTIVTVGDEPLCPDPQSLGFRYLFVHTPDFHPPPRLAEIVGFVDASIEEGHGVLVHCFAGIGRTGTVLAAWLLRHDPSLSADEAIRRVRDDYIPDYARNRFPEHPDQEAALARFARAR